MHHDAWAKRFAALGNRHLTDLLVLCAMGGAPPPDSTGQTIPPQETATLERLIDALEKPLMELREQFALDD